MLKQNSFLASIFSDIFSIDSKHRFRLLTCFKILLGSISSLVILLLLVWLLLEMNFGFFKAYEVKGLSEFKKIFYTYLSTQFLNTLPYMIAQIALILFIGLYIANLMLRPFEQISRHCHNLLNGENTSEYNSDFFSDLKLLTSFSEYFFNALSRVIKDPKDEVVVPKKYKKFHTPIFEAGFFFQFSFLILIISVLNFIGVYHFVQNLYEAVLKFAELTLASDKHSTDFLLIQYQVFQTAITLTLAFHILINIFLVFHLYFKVAIPAFGIFATMRSYLKGNRKARIHLLGHYFLRRDTKVINLYLREVEKKLTQN